MEGLSANIAYKKTYNGYVSNSKVGWGGLEVEDYTEGHDSNTRDEFFGRATYSKTFNDFDLSATAGFELTKYSRRRINASAVGGLTTPGFYSLNTSTDRPSLSSQKYEFENKAWFTTASVGYKNMAYAEASYRTDYSSTADANANSVKTLGISGSFILSQLIENKELISFAKARVGYAQAPYFPGTYLLSQTYASGTPYGSTGTSSVPNSGVNPQLKGGEREELEFGAEVKFLKNRIGIDFAYFDRTDKNLPSFVTVPGSTGITGYYSNQGEETYKGIEVGLNFVPFKGEDFNMDVTINAATLKRDVVKIADGVDVNVLDSWGPSVQKRVGQEWGAIYGNAYRRDANGTKVLAANGRYEYDTNQYLGSILPDVTGGVTANMSYKNLSLSLGFDYQIGGKFYGVTRRYGNFAGLGVETVGNNALGNPVRSAVADTGTSGSSSVTSVNLANAASNSGGQLTSGVDASGNPVSFLVNPYYLWRSNLRNVHEEYINDATYVKLRTISFGYKLPSDLVEKTPFSGIDLGIFANNVWLIHSDVKGVDPSETEGRAGINWIENGQLPSARTIGFNAKFTF